MPRLVSPLLLCALAAPALAQSAPPALPLKPTLGRVIEVEAEFSSTETATTVDVDGGVTYRSVEVSTESDRAVYLDRVDALRDTGGVLKRTHYVLSASTSTKTTVRDEENGKALPAEAPETSETKSKLTGRHLVQEWISPLETQLNEVGPPKLKLWDVDSSLFAFELESYFPKTLPKPGTASGKEFLAQKSAKVFPGWPQELRMAALAQVVGMTAAYGKQGLKSVSWKVTQAPAAKGKGPSITYSVKVELKGAAGKDVSEALTAELQARYEVRAPSKAFPAPPK